MRTAVLTPLPDYFVTRHALDRVREHHPNCGWRGVLRMLLLGRSIERGEVSGFLHRPMERCLDTYVLAHDRRGIYVIAPGRTEDERMAVVTYIRLLPSQQETALAIWGTA